MIIWAKGVVMLFFFSIHNISGSFCRWYEWSGNQCRIVICGCWQSGWLSVGRGLNIRKRYSVTYIKCPPLSLSDRYQIIYHHISRLYQKLVSSRTMVHYTTRTLFTDTLRHTIFSSVSTYLSNNITCKIKIKTGRYRYN